MVTDEPSKKKIPLTSRSIVHFVEMHDGSPGGANDKPSHFQVYVAKDLGKVSVGHCCARSCDESVLVMSPMWFVGTLAVRDLRVLSRMCHLGYFVTTWPGCSFFRMVVEATALH